MPAPATAIATQVRGGCLWRRKIRAKTAVSSGLIDIVTSTLATRVIVSATMKAVNITLQHRPDIHTTRGDRNRSAHRLQPRIHVSARPRATRLNRLRKNVTSKLSAVCSDRLTTPAVLHIRVTRTMPKAARAWLMEGDGFIASKCRRSSSGAAAT